MYWHRLERAYGRFSLVGTTVKDPERLPPHLVADEKHTTLAGKKIYLAATAGGGCCLGLMRRWPRRRTRTIWQAPTACSGMRPGIWIRSTWPQTVNTDGWPPRRRLGGRSSRE